MGFGAIKIYDKTMKLIKKSQLKKYLKHSGIIYIIKQI